MAFFLSNKHGNRLRLHTKQFAPGVSWGLYSGYIGVALGFYTAGLLLGLHLQRKNMSRSACASQR